MCPQFDVQEGVSLSLPVNAGLDPNNTTRARIWSRVVYQFKHNQDMNAMISAVPYAHNGEFSKRGLCKPSGTYGDCRRITMVPLKDHVKGAFRCWEITDVPFSRILGIMMLT